MESGGQDQAYEGQHHEDKGRSDGSEHIPAESHSKGMTEPSPWPGNVELLLPLQKDQMLKIKEG